MANKFVPLLYFLAALMASSIALVAAAFSVVKDATAFFDWQRALLAFIFWMALTIVFATLCALYIQWRRIVGAATDLPRWFDYAVAAIPAGTGFLAALHLMIFACRHGAHVLFI
ncbi:MAG: hypothetical protein ACYC5H_11800 [Methylovirgula sp.]